MSKNLITNTNNYSTMKVGNHTIQTLTIDNETYSPIRELLVALGVTSEESVRNYMITGNRNYVRNIKNNPVAVQTVLQLKFQSKDGKYYNTDSLNLKDIFKFVQILSPRNKVLKDKANRYFFKMEEVVLGTTQSKIQRKDNKNVNKLFNDYIFSLDGYYDKAHQNIAKQISKVAFDLYPKEIRDKYNIKGRDDYSLESNNYISFLENLAMNLHIESGDTTLNNLYYVIIKETIKNMFKPKLFIPLSLCTKTKRILLDKKE